MLACQRRFRPIILTTLTTFGGLAPMVFEPSRQAQFVVPMAVSLGFGIIFTTFICLLMLPSLYIAFNQNNGHKAESESFDAN
jgi:multidrug efflux pump subunit AcrB